MSSVEKVSRVLVGVDFDDASASALKMAGVLASTWDADVTVFHASTPDAPAYFTGDQIETRAGQTHVARSPFSPPQAMSAKAMRGSMCSGAPSQAPLFGRRICITVLRICSRTRI
jgi:Universal stress protein family